MAWTDSKIFQRYLVNMINNTLPLDYDTDPIKVALFDGTITPDNDVATDVLASYGGTGSAWVAGGEVTDGDVGGADWPNGGQTLTTKTVDEATADVVKVDADDVASGSTADISGAEGCLVYNNAAGLTDKLGLCYNYFGGPNSVTNGTFTIVWNSTNGILRFTL